MSEQQKTGSVTALGVISIVFGLMAMLISFIPCFGSYALFLSIIPLIMGCAGYYIAKKSEQSTGLPLTGMLMSLIGFSIAGLQYYNIVRWSSRSAGTTIGIFIFLVWALVLVFLFFVNKTNGSSDSYSIEKPEFINNINLSSLLSLNKKPEIDLNCTKCQTKLTANDVFCSGCGTNVQSYIQMTLLANCPSCDNSVTSNDMFCSGCGFNINEYKQSQNQTKIRPTLINGNNNCCNNCGKEYLSGDSFCESCGNKLK